MQLKRSSIDSLRTGFQADLCQFEDIGRSVFVGPSLYFHVRTIQQRRRHQDPAALLADDRYFEYLYATLTAWGLHHMGKTAAKLTDFASFRSGCQRLFEPLAHLYNSSILTLNVSDPGAERVGTEVGDAIAAACGITCAKAKLVAHTKALHHFLPDLVPPMDREYTLNWLLGTKSSPIEPHLMSQTFALLFQGFVEVGKGPGNEQVIRDAVCRGVNAYGCEETRVFAWHTGHAKVLDNALIGFAKGTPVG